jgi:hypothetical protein
MLPDIISYGASYRHDFFVGQCWGETARHNGSTFGPGITRAVPPVQQVAWEADRVANQVGAGAAGYDPGYHQGVASRRSRPDWWVMGMAGRINPQIAAQCGESERPRCQIVLSWNRL